MNPELEIICACPCIERQISDFFSLLAESQESHYFFPHPLTPEQASIIANYTGKDFYAFVFYNGQAIGYGMLRGWDSGYEIPSLGISVRPDFRGTGIGELLMHYLHNVAMLRGCKKIRLRVKKDNHRAMKLYLKLGYKLNDEDGEGYIVGFIQLKR
mgnify:CR=1 FL=1